MVCTFRTGIHLDQGERGVWSEILFVDREFLTLVTVDRRETTPNSDLIPAFPFRSFVIQPLPWPDPTLLP